MTAANEALSTDKPAAVTFNTLAAAQELRKSGLEDRQAEAIVTTISKAIRLGALMVSMTFLLLAFGPFYIRWVMSVMASQ